MQHRTPTLPELPNAVAGYPRDPAASRAATLLLLAALATVVAVVGRVLSNADRADLMQSLAAIADSPELYGIGGAARCLSGIALAGAGWFLWRAWFIRQRLGSPLVPILFAASGASTAISGVCAVALALVAGDLVALGSPGPVAEVTADFRWIAGKLGFSVAGLALLVASRYQWQAGGVLRRIAPLSAIIGIAMLLIWYDGVTALHRISGIAFVLWLGVVGAVLLSARSQAGHAPSGAGTGPA